MSIHITFSYKTNIGNYDTVSKTFASEDEITAWFEEIKNKGYKITGQLITTMVIEQWDWDLFFNMHPEYITQGTWDNALVMANRMKSMPLTMAIESRNLEKSKDYYYEHNVS